MGYLFFSSLLKGVTRNECMRVDLFLFLEWGLCVLVRGKSLDE